MPACIELLSSKLLQGAKCSLLVAGSKSNKGQGLQCKLCTAAKIEATGGVSTGSWVECAAAEAAGLSARHCMMRNAMPQHDCRGCCFFGPGKFCQDFDGRFESDVDLVEKCWSLYHDKSLQRHCSATAVPLQ
jgi:hypothetical protein